ncbi:uncharacterized protein LOC141886568 isoform X2 [Acropora palmata]|uniref:uncharacterized protein LOC141886568 isoform X2 n=1 Tax=Acropora palmata TaxID=6131 RepID=UPI003DA17E14
MTSTIYTFQCWRGLRSDETPVFPPEFKLINTSYGLSIALSMIRLTSKLNFTKTTSFNLVLFVNVDSVRMVKERMMGEGAVDIQTAHFYVKNSHQSRDRTGFLGYCKTTLGSEETLNTDCFLRTGLIEGYVEFLQVSFHPSKRR